LVKITVDVDSETYHKLKMVAESRGISVYALVKEVLKSVARATPTEKAQVVAGVALVSDKASVASASPATSVAVASKTGADVASATTASPATSYRVIDRSEGDGIVVEVSDSEPKTTNGGSSDSVTSTAGNLLVVEVKQAVESNTRTSGTTTNTGSIGANKANTITKCYEKSKMKYPVESNIAYFRSKGLLVDWWEEGDNKVCFELKKSEDKKQQRKEQEDESWLLQYIDQ
jgi:hypothetical protein